MMSLRAGMQGADPHQWLSKTTPLFARRSILGVIAGSFEPYVDRNLRFKVSHRIKITFNFFPPLYNSMIYHGSCFIEPINKVISETPIHP
jgi:hypothetical protein